MAKAKPTDTNKSEPKTAPKIADITADGSVGATASSRPVIVQNRPIMQDPMMVASTSNTTVTDEKTAGSPSTEDPVSAPLLDQKLDPPSVTKKKIVPPSEQAADDTASKAEETKPATKIDVVGVVIHDSIPEADKPVEPAKNDATKPGTTDKASTESSAGKSETSDESSQNEADQTDDETNKKLDAANAVADTREAEEAAKITKLVESKAYVLPINAIQRRRAQQMAVLGLLVIIVLAFAWLDLATDVGLIKVPYLPVTHFFSNS